MRVLCDGKKKPKKRVYKFLNQFTVIYINFQIFTTKEYLHTKVHQMQTNIHKEKGVQNLLSIYENLQFPKFTTRTCMHHKSIKVEG
jgi:sialic acid synthase SpsE